MATTRTADQILDDLADLLETKVLCHEAHPTHPLLAGGPYRVEENEFNSITFNGKVVNVHYKQETFAYQEQDFYGRLRNVDSLTVCQVELKPTAAVKRHLGKFIGCTFESVAEFKAVLLDEAEQDAPGTQVVSAAGIIDAINKNNFVALGALELIENKGITESQVEFGIKQISAKNGVLTIQKGYSLVGSGGDCLQIRDEFVDDYDENDYYEFQDLVPNAQVRHLLREAGFAGTWRAQFKMEHEYMMEILSAQARIDKLRALID